MAETSIILVFVLVALGIAAILYIEHDKKKSSPTAPQVSTVVPHAVFHPQPQQPPRQQPIARPTPTPQPTPKPQPVVVAKPTPRPAAPHLPASGYLVVASAAQSGYAQPGAVLLHAGNGSAPPPYGMQAIQGNPPHVYGEFQNVGYQAAMFFEGQSAGADGSWTARIYQVPRYAFGDDSVEYLLTTWEAPMYGAMYSVEQSAIPNGMSNPGLIWHFIPNGDGTYAVRNQWTNQYLAAYSGRQQNTVGTQNVEVTWHVVPL
jgi:hypothetical protein